MLQALETKEIDTIDIVFDSTRKKVEPRKTREIFANQAPLQGSRDSIASEKAGKKPILDEDVCGR